MIETIAICNMCGKKIHPMDIECNQFSLSHEFGYGSIYDCQSLQLDLCSDCQDALTTYLIKNCKINPIEKYDTNFTIMKQIK